MAIFSRDIFVKLKRLIPAALQKKITVLDMKLHHSYGRILRPLALSSLEGKIVYKDSIQSR